MVSGAMPGPTTVKKPIATGHPSAAATARRSSDRPPASAKACFFFSL